MFVKNNKTNVHSIQSLILTANMKINTMRKILPKTLNLLIFSIYSLNFSLEFMELVTISHNLPNVSKFLPPQRHKTIRSY